MDLFDSLSDTGKGVPEFRPDAPLAVRMRPRNVEELVGQSHLLAPNSPLQRLLRGDTEMTSSVILYGPPGTGKTTLAYLVAQAGGRDYAQLSAINAGVKEVREVINAAKQRLSLSGQETILFLDEVHRFSKSQQDSLLPAVENRWVILVAATTENPAFSVISPLLSRSLLLTLQPLTNRDIEIIMDRALADERGLGGKYTLTPDARESLIRLAGADGRKALTLLEAAAGGADSRAASEITEDDVAAAADTAVVRYGIDEHYDVASAFIKSMRGSDPDAALHYLARMIKAGEDPRFIARRVVIAAAEDVGLADPSVLPLAVAAAQAVQLIGMPEGRIPLAEAVVAVATAPKSNRAYVGINSALADVESGNIGTVPTYLRDQHYPGAATDRKIVGTYRYPHDDTRGIVTQQYLPDPLKDKIYYEPSAHGWEVTLGDRLAKIRKIQKMG
ncbi:replication-associated recombination protein A [Mobiluncus curtisii]|jgi:hypothetical protein|uniref:Recombination factor protein RarA n=3 Tax=Mobiluncus curtisii TaxID=2051 RepID=D6ZHE2_MOBCV|nr:replication-associated recombination protein A [Mobiluncus curtisii]ADI68050.1 recombination factor protein RarA [Mobiluncus curtisii ATCC 43063]EFU79967.1 ATPase, AAA family [Mobiluncus curtisii ATCC 51333]QQU08294.1 replication-associated recombination protein A [Mobiluncus curtisii]SQB64517.1 Replication-associated recombination protein A [Mobiluncus curtisii]